jgi:hypothetical protein
MNFYFIFLLMGFFLINYLKGSLNNFLVGKGRFGFFIFYLSKNKFTWIN